MVPRPRPKIFPPLTKMDESFHSHYGQPNYLMDYHASPDTLYSVVSTVVRLCEDLGIPWVIENPANSYMWLTTPLRGLPSFPSVCFHNCMYGGSRPKLTKLMHHGLNLSSLHLVCDDSHQHLPWKVQGPNGPEFRTALERAYPVNLCKAIVQLTLHQCLAQGYEDLPVSLSSSSKIAAPFFRRRSRGGVGVQPRGHQLAVYLMVSMTHGFLQNYLTNQISYLKLTSNRPHCLDIAFADGSLYQCQVQNPRNDTKVKILTPVQPEDYVICCANGCRNSSSKIGFYELVLDMRGC